MSKDVEFGLYLPQVAFEYSEIIDKAHLIESLGFDSMWFYDHLYSPGIPAMSSLEGWTLATAILAQTERLRVGHLVLCNNFRHPALLAKMASTLDVISNGRLDLGIGSGSVETEHNEMGIPWGSLKERTDRLEESLEIITSMFSGEPTSFHGKYFDLDNVPNLPLPVQRPHLPIHIGGIGPIRTLPLVARYADVWNIPTYGLSQWIERQDDLDAECAQIQRDPATIERSLEAVLVLAPDEASLPALSEKAHARFAGEGWGLDAGGFIGTPPMIIERIETLRDQGISTFVFFFADRAKPESLKLFAEEVMPAFSTR
ncbi:MAG: LLM class flavin-dependent oxidoreductase [Actinobacteria bacterium]|uniref:Unannotated protein n=1 Tax=freshwater metagenome TaxID=449393 RepID=A0A6J7AK74_9ZZZZ|nr:LLM class flavin-dependent oxidoreductase [Actinomycetota bacterium]MSX10299.1 LLM class flavin-dependent oxidoreductase [Actinomycetota bacterium]MSX68704.1 LLM class flavin-dependent oxidoreductase [Actinomycetota bacterium]